MSSKYMQITWNRKMTRVQHVVALLVTTSLLQVSVVVAQNATGVFSESTLPCPTDSTIRGYTTIGAMNRDMASELSLIRRGSASREPYIFVLCPSTIFDMSDDTLRPLLSGSIFTCGITGNPASDCDFSGGSNQVVIDDPVNVTGYRLSMVSFVGVTFTGFANSAISGNASDTTTVDLTRSNFEEFDSMFAVLQRKGNGQKPFNVQVFNSSVTGADGGTVFANIGGELTLEDITVDSSTLMSLSSTGSSTGSVGATFVRGIRVADSDIMDIFVAMEGADLDAMNVNVNNMQNMLNIFDIAGEGSTATIDGFVVENNDLSSATPPVRWTGVNIRDDASGTVTNTRFTGNTNVRHVFSASSSSRLNIQGAMVSATTGGRAVDQRDVSAVVFANIRSTVTATNVETEGTDEFTSAIFSNAASSINVATSCVGTGTGQGAVYVSEDSTYTTTDNYIDPAYASSVCTEPGMHLIQEQANSGCFQANRTDCEFDCLSFFDAASCRAQFEIISNTTNVTAPVAAPVIAPVAAPVASVVVAPVAAPLPPPTRQPIAVTLAPVTLAPMVVPSSVPSIVPSSMPVNASTRAPSPTLDSRPTLRPTLAPKTTPKTGSPITPTMRPSCDCSGKGKGKDKKKEKSGKGKGKGGSDDDASFDDDFWGCECPSHKSKKSGKGKGKGDKGKGKGSGKGSGKGGGKGLSAWVEREHIAQHESRANNALHHMGGY